MPDRDIINETKFYTFGASYILGSAIYFIIRQMNMLIERRRIDLLDKKPGVVMPDYPKIIWTRMLKRPKHIMTLGSNKALSIRGRFNAVLEEQLAAAGDNLRLISITIPDSEFDLSGYLTSARKASFWREIDRGMKKFNEGDIKLLPRNNNSQKHQDKEKSESSSNSGRNSDIKPRSCSSHRTQSRSSSRHCYHSESSCHHKTHSEASMH